MASEADIALVKTNIAEDPGDDWNDDAIAVLLDAGLSVTKVTLAFWTGRAAKYANVVDVSESGSSRQLSNLFNQAKAMVDFWTEKDKYETNPPIIPRTRVAFHKLKRV